jgi:hypothetical protein
MLACAIPAAAITVDGTLDADYGPPLVVQTVQTQFGDAMPPGSASGSELDAVYALVEGGRLFLMFTGNLEPNFNKLNIFIDAQTGGENTLSPTPDYEFFNGTVWLSTNLNGLTFDAGFTADFHLVARWGPAPAPFEVDFVDRQGGGAAMVPNSTGSGAAAVGLVSTGSIAAGAAGIGPNASGPALSQPLEFAINDNNAAGVLGGTGPADQAAAAAVTTGMEFSVDLADIGGPAPGSTILISAMISNGDHNFVSNQILGGLPAPQGNLGGDGAGGFIGDLSGVDFNRFGGLQHFMVTIPRALCPADLDGSGSVGFQDLTLLLGNWGPCDTSPCPWDIDGDGSVGLVDLSTLIAAWGPCP